MLVDKGPDGLTLGIARELAVRLHHVEEGVGGGACTDAALEQTGQGQELRAWVSGFGADDLAAQEGGIRYMLA